MSPRDGKAASIKDIQRHLVISGSFRSLCFVAFLCECSGEWCLSSRALGRSKTPLEAAVMHERVVILYMIFASCIKLHEPKSLRRLQNVKLQVLRMQRKAEGSTAS